MQVCEFRLDQWHRVGVKSLWMEVLGAKRDLITLITLPAVMLSMFLSASGAAQEGYYGAGHDNWHQGFYSKLKTFR